MPYPAHLITYYLKENSPLDGGEFLLQISEKPVYFLMEAGPQGS
jgi:hypothetical protein